MKSIDTSNLKGTEDFFGKEQIIRNYIIDTLKNIFNNLEAFSIYLENGKKRLKEMPTSRERTKQYISLINNSLES